MFTIAFICTANMCRSVMAHAICAAEVGRRGLGTKIYSAGTMDLAGAEAALDAILTCTANQTPVKKRRSTFVAEIPLSAIDRFFVMEKSHGSILIRDYGVDAQRLTLLAKYDPEGGAAEIEDPVNRGSAAFASCYERLRRCICHYLDTTEEIPGA